MLVQIQEEVVPNVCERVWLAELQLTKVTNVFVVYKLATHKECKQFCRVPLQMSLCIKLPLSETF